MRRIFKGRERAKWARTTSAFTALFVLGLLTAATFGGAGYAFVGSSSVTATDSRALLSASPSISSDKEDYNPGSTVTLTGHSWDAGESVHVFVNDDVGQSWSYTTDVTADGSGDFSLQFQLPTSFVATYSVTATGATGSTATTSFTDGNVSFQLATVDNAAPAGLHWTVNWKKYNNSTVCNDGTTGISTGSTAYTGNSVNSGGGNAEPGVGNGQSAKPTGVTTSDTTVAFDYWSTAANSATHATAAQICVPGNNGGTLYAHFALTIKSTSTSLASSSNPSTYGDSVSLTATVTVTGGGTPAGTVTFKDGGTNITGCVGVAVSGGTATCAKNDLSAGGSPHGITAAFNGGTGFADSTSSQLSQAVNKATLTVTADDKSRSYGDTNPSLTAGYSGFKLGESASVLSGAPSCSTTATAASPVAGSPYPITCTAGTLSAANYNFSFAAGRLTVSRAHLRVAADDTSRLYGDANPGFSATLTGFANGETLGSSGVTGAAACASAADSTSSVAGSPYTIVCTQGTLAAANYDFTPFVSGQLTVNKAHLTVTADDTSRLYGDADPSFTATVSGFKNGENGAGANLTGAAACVAAATGTSSVAGGPYPINCTAGTLSAPNYDFTTFVAGRLTVNKNHLAVWPDDQTRAYGADNPPLTYQLLGLKNSETVATAEVTGSANCTTSAGPASPVSGNPYSITCTSGNLAAPNYDVTSALPGTLTVTPAHLTVTADGANREYGDANPGFTATLSGFENGEAQATSGVSGSPSCSSAATVTSPVPGPYAITCTQGTLTAGNYDFPTYVAGKLTLTKAPLTVTAQDASRQYGDPNPVFTATLTGFKNGETPVSAGVTGAASCASTADAFSSVPGPYAIDCAQGTLSAPDYDFSQFVAGSLTLTKAHLTVTASDLSRPYGSANPSFAYTFSGFKNFDNPFSAGIIGAASCNSAALPSSPVLASPFAITCTAGTLGAPNYDFANFVAGKLTIDRAHLIVSADDKSRLYGEANPALTAQLSGFTNGETLETSGVIGLPHCTTDAAPWTSVADSPRPIACDQGTLTAANYDFTPFADGKLTIDKAHLTVAANDATREYGAGDPALTYVLEGLANGEDALTVVSGSAACTSAAAANSPVSGSPYVISCTEGTLDAANYDFPTFLNGRLTLTKAPLIVTAEDTSREYGDPNPAFTHHISGFKNGEDESALTSAPSCDSAATATSPVPGPYSIACSGAGSGNYDFTYEPGQLTLTKAPLTVTADDAGREYGDPNPTFTDHVTGFKNGQTLATSGVTGNPSLTTPADTTSDFGTYPVNAALGTLSSNNYGFQFHDGTLTITKAPLTITAADKTKIYGDGNPALTGTIAGLKNSDGISAGYSTAATEASDVGSYPIEPLAIDSSPAKLGNYDVTLVDGSLSITKAPLTITAADKTKIYGDGNPSLTGTIAGLKNADGISASYSTAATPASAVGSYAITPAPVDSSPSKLGNYDVSLVNGSLSITRAPLTITAADKTKVYGDANPALTGTITGLKNGDGISAAYTTAATQASDVGSYAITPAAVDSTPAKLANYDLTLVNGSLSITKAPLDVTADAENKVYGATNPSFTAGYGGFKLGQILGNSGVSGSPSLTTAADQTADVGAYPISTALGTLTADNYRFVLHDGTLTVIKAPLDVTAVDTSRVYGNANPTLTASYSGFKLGQDLVGSGVAGQPDLTTAADQTSNVGSYAINTALGTLGSGNYTFILHDGTLTVAKAPLDVTADDKSRLYGDANPSLTASYGGFKLGQTLATSGVSGAPGLSTAATPSSPVGSYAIAATSGTLSSGNYSFVLHNGTLTVTKAPVTVLADSKTKLLNAVNPPLTASYAGLKLGQTLAGSGISGVPGLSTPATSSSPIGSYQITVSLGTLSSANYSFSFVNGVLTVIYGTNGFLQPINDTAHTQTQMSVFKAGSTIPVKFQLLDASGAPVAATLVPQWVTPVIVATTTDPVDESLYTDQPTSGFAYRWDATAKQYIYNWPTTKGDAGKVFRIGARLDDGTTMYVNIGLR